MWRSKLPAMFCVNQTAKKIKSKKIELEEEETHEKEQAWRISTETQIHMYVLQTNAPKNIWPKQTAIQRTEQQTWPAKPDLLFTIYTSVIGR